MASRTSADIPGGVETCRIIPGNQGMPNVPRLAANHAVLGSRAMWEVLRWMIVFVLALLLIVVAIYLVTGRPLPIPQF